MDERFEFEETTAEKIAGMQATIDQMERMIAENHRMINLGDDVEGRQNMIKHLTNEINVHKARIKQLEESE